MGSSSFDSNNHHNSNKGGSTTSAGGSSSTSSMSIATILHWLILVGAIAEIVRTNQRLAELIAENDLSSSSSSSSSSSNSQKSSSSRSSSSRHDFVSIPPWKTTLDAGTESTRLYLLELPGALMKDYGVSLTKAQAEQEEHITEQLATVICSKSGKRTQDYCRDNLELLKCVTCSAEDGAWYYASSLAGSASGIINEEGGLNVFDNSGTMPGGAGLPKELSTLTTWKVDMVVPLSGQDDRMRRFATRLGPCLRELRRLLELKGITLQIRLMTTRYPKDRFDTPEENYAFQAYLASEGALDGPESVVLIDVDPKEGSKVTFNRATAINALHANACHEDTCIVTVMDVDMLIAPIFFFNAFSFVHAGITSYFPIMWSEYNPETVELAMELHEKHDGVELDTFDPHQGVWLEYSHAISALAGSDAQRIILDDNFDGWGGEDNAFQAQVSEVLHMVRLHDKGLIHKWHTKACKPGFVLPSYMTSCIGSKAALEGSTLGYHLRSMKMGSAPGYEKLMDVNSELANEQ